MTAAIESPCFCFKHSHYLARYYDYNNRLENANHFINSRRFGEARSQKRPLIIPKGGEKLKKDGPKQLYLVKVRGKIMAVMMQS